VPDLTHGVTNLLDSYIMRRAGSARLPIVEGIMFRSSSKIALLILACVPAWCMAQSPTCGVGGIPLTATGSVDPFVSVSPASPTAGPFIGMAAGIWNYQPHFVNVSGSASIDITINASYLGLTPPPALQCGNVPIGPMQQGSYPVRLFLQRADLPSFPTSLVATGTLTIGTGITVAVASTGSTMLSYTMPLLQTCWAPGVTTISKAPGQLNLVSEAIPQGCFPTPPPALPPTAIVDVGYLSAGSYQVTWALTFPTYPPGTGPSVANATTSFVINADQVAQAVPTLAPAGVLLLIASCGVLGATWLRRRSGQWRS